MMYKVLLVDDKSWVLEDIKNIINWREHGFEIVGTASSGSAALSMIKRVPPDIVFSDIEMPDINGFELLEIINQKYKGIVTVFVSAYDKFSYARDAIRLGAIDYLLKPVEKESLLSVLGKAAEEFEKRRAEADNRVTLLFLNYISDYPSNKTDNGSFFRLLNDAGYTIKNKNFVVGIIKSGEKLPISSFGFKDYGVDFYCVPIGIKRYAFFAGFPANSEGKSIAERQLRFFGEQYRLTIGVSEPLDKSRNIARAINQADIAVEQDFITGKNGTYFYSACDTAVICKKIRETVSKNEVSDFVKNLQKELIDFSINIEGLNAVCTEILRKLSYEEERIKSLVQAEPKLYVETYGDIYGLIANLTEATGGDEDSRFVSNALISEVIGYINDNYKSRILIQDIAKKFSVNSNYLSMLFKNTCGKSFTSYLIDLRLSKAKELLRDSGLSLYEISEKVGYDDYFHFSKIFKKYNGVSPANYRKNNQN